MVVRKWRNNESSLLVGTWRTLCWAYGGKCFPRSQRFDGLQTKECLYKGIEKAWTLATLFGEILVQRIQEYASKGWRAWLGRTLVLPTMHEEPMVPHYGRTGRGLPWRGWSWRLSQWSIPVLGRLTDMETTPISTLWRWPCQWPRSSPARTKMVQWSWLVKVKKEHTKTREKDLKA